MRVPREASPITSPEPSLVTPPALRDVADDLADRGRLQEAGQLTGAADQRAVVRRDLVQARPAAGGLPCRPGPGRGGGRRCPSSLLWKQAVEEESMVNGMRGAGGASGTVKANCPCG